MPELPEVEIVRRNLERWLIGQQILEVLVLRPSIFKDEGADRARSLEGSIARAIHRRGKVLWLETSAELGWLMRFGMTGKWVKGEGGEPPRFARAGLRLAGRDSLWFCDMRCLGGIWVAEREQGRELLKAAVKGRDPILEGLDGASLEEGFRGRRLPIKALLLDQSLIAGVGNIYASESLYRAGIHPWASAGDLDRAACDALASSILEVLEWAIKAEDRDEIRYFGEGGVENIFQVYQRTGEPCRRCGTAIERCVIAARGTFFCPRCQRIGVG